MVQCQIPFEQKDPFIPREMAWLPDRSFAGLPQRGRFAAQHIHPRCLPVETALRDCARVSVKEFALLVLDESGEVKTYTSASLTPLQPKLFPNHIRQNFRDCVQRATGGYDTDALHSDFGPELNLHALRSGSLSSGGGRTPRPLMTATTGDEGTASSGKRKRAAPARARTLKANKAAVAAIPGRKKQRLVIGDGAEVQEFYMQRFREMQQTTCKVIAKAFVKLVEPKKQSSHPYTKGNEGAPPWWPSTEGPDGVIHKEPDHLLRGPRVVLIVHILKMITGPRSKQVEPVQRQELTISKLKEVTMESMANWFNDKTISPTSRDKKKALLKEIFKVAEIEERYLQGGMDSSTTVQVVPYGGDHAMLETSEDEGSDDDLIKVENESRLSMVISTAPSDDMVSPTTLVPNQSLQQPDAGDYYRARPPPGRTYSHSQLDDHHSFGSGSYIARGFQPENPMQDPNRRIFPPTSFQPPSFPGPQGMYDWQNNMTSGDPVPANFYIPASPQSLMPSPPPYQPAPPIPQHGMLPLRMNEPQFDISSGRYDSAPALGNQLRTGSLHHPHQVSQGFHDYLHNPGPYGHPEPEIKDNLHPS